MSADAKISANDVAGAVHDARQMLAVITGRVGLLSRGNKDPQLQKNLDAMALAAAGTEQILARLMFLAGGKNEIKAAPGDLLRALKQSVALIQPQPGTEWQWKNAADRDSSSSSSGNSSGNAWMLNADFSEGCLTTIPEEILREILNNLLLNALQVMPNGGSVQVCLESRDEHWLLSVQDSGPGVPTELVDAIFEPGYSTSTEDGRGIGLAYCRDILAGFAGRLEYSTSEQPGACFNLHLPKMRIADDFAPLTENVTANSQQNHPTFRPQILIVDDEQSVREMLEDVFGELGCQVKVARDAPQAERIFSTHRFEMAVIDQSLPGISGLDLARRLRKQDSHLVSVLISGWGQEEILDLAHQTDVDLVAEKPITLEKIMELLNEAGILYHQRSEGS